MRAGFVRLAGDGSISESEFLNFYSQCLASDKKRRKYELRVPVHAAAAARVTFVRLTYGVAHRYIKKLEDRYKLVMALPDDALLG